MTELNPTNKTYSIYAGDFQFRTPQDQGPMQNAVFDKGVVPVSLRHLYSDSTAPSYVVRIFKAAYQDIQQGQSTYPFTGIVGMGDYIDLGCEQEKSPIAHSIRLLLAEDPELRFVLMARGNHDGGQYMGTIYSLKNFFGFLGRFWSDPQNEYQQDICGGRGNTLPVGEAIGFFDGLVRQEPGTDFDDIISDVREGGRKKYLSNNTKTSFEDTKKVFADLWHQTLGEERWDAIIHLTDEPHDRGHHRKKGREGIVDGSFSDTPGEVRQWIHLQAFKQTEFVAKNNTTIPVYQVALDSQDFTSFGEGESSIQGHISQFQVSVVENFIDHKLLENPNAKFKLVMHYPIDNMPWSSRQALKRLMNRDEVILIVDAHSHVRGFTSDMNDEYSLSRKTPLPRISIPATADERNEVVIEEMNFVDHSGNYSLELRFTFRGLTEEEVAPLQQHPAVYERLEILEQTLLGNKHALYQRLKERGIDTTQLVDARGHPQYTYLNEDEVIAQIKDTFVKEIANGQDSRVAQVWYTLRLWFDYKERLMDELTTWASIPQMLADFEIFLIFVECIRDLLLDEGYVGIATEMSEKILFMQEQQKRYLQEYALTAEHQDIKERTRHNDLYTRSDMDGMFNFINQRIPEGSNAQLFAIIAGMRALHEEASYHGYSGRDAEVPDTIVVSQTHNFS